MEETRTEDFCWELTTATKIRRNLLHCPDIEAPARNQASRDGSPSLLTLACNRGLAALSKTLTLVRAEVTRLNSIRKLPSVECLLTSATTIFNGCPGSVRWSQTRCRSPSRTAPVLWCFGFARLHRQSARRLAHSKTWRKFERVQPTRQRLGVRRSSAAFHESTHSEFVRLMERPRAFDAVHRVCCRRVMKSPVGFFAEHWDHEPVAPK